MPDRLIREDILTSESVNTLTWFAEVFYRRLLNKLDDAGRYEARPELLRTSLFPLKTNQVSATDISKLLNECVSAGLVRCYEVGGKQYLEVHKFGQRLKYPKLKYPPPSDEEKRREEEFETETEVEVEVERMRDPSVKKFYLRGHLLNQSASTFLMEKYEAKLEVDFMKDLKHLNMQAKLLEFNDKAFLMQYKEESHVYNSFIRFCKTTPTNTVSVAQANFQSKLTEEDKKW